MYAFDSEFLYWHNHVESEIERRHKRLLSMHFSMLSRRKTCILFELSYKMVLVFVSDKSCYCFDRISCVYQAILGALNPQHKQIVLRRDAENLFIKRIKTGFAQIHKLGHLFYRPVIWEIPVYFISRSNEIISLFSVNHDRIRLGIGWP